MNESGCPMWDEYNNCCMWDRIEKIVRYPWEWEEEIKGKEESHCTIMKITD